MVKQRALPRDLLTKLIVSHDTFIGKDVNHHEMNLYKIIIFGDGERYVLVARFSKLEELLAARSIALIRRNCLKPGTTITNSFKPGVTLTDNQQVVYDYLTQSIYAKEKVRDGSASCILVMGTGEGKTYMGGAFIKFVRTKTLIMVPRKAPIPEWVGMLTKYFPALTIGEYHDQCKKDGDIIIINIDTALRIEKRLPNFYDQFGAIIFDEVHNYPTAKRVEIFWKTNCRFALGLTATPDERLDGMDAVTWAHLGPLVRANQLPGYSASEIEWKGKVRAIMYHGSPEFTQPYTNVKGWTDTQRMCAQFISDPDRTRLIIREIIKLYKKDKYVFVFSDRREYLDTLHKNIMESGLKCYFPEHSQTLRGGATPEDHDNARKNAKIILITYGYGVESISIPKMDAIIFATSRRNKMRQTIGRILRRSGNPNSKRVIVDIVDKNTSLRSQFSTRKKVYEEKGFPIHTTTVTYEELRREGDKKEDKKEVKEDVQTTKIGRKKSNQNNGGRSGEK